MRQQQTIDNLTINCRNENQKGIGQGNTYDHVKRVRSNTRHVNNNNTKKNRGEAARIHLHVADVGSMCPRLA